MNQDSVKTKEIINLVERNAVIHHCGSDELYQDALTLYKNGTFFSKGMDWFDDVFLSPIISSTTYIVFFFIFLYATVLSLQNMSILFPLKSKIEMVIMTNNSGDDVLTINPLINYKNPFLDISSFLIQEYVKTRESFEYSGIKIEDLRRKVDIVKKLSSTKVFREYQQMLSGENELSRLNDFVRGNNRQIQIKNFSFVHNKQSRLSKIISKFFPVKKSNNAVVYFDSITDGKITNWKVNISFAFELPVRNKNDFINFSLAEAMKNSLFYRIKKIINPKKENTVSVEKNKPQIIETSKIENNEKRIKIPFYILDYKLSKI